jgi:hypothetical protein
LRSKKVKAAGVPAAFTILCGSVVPLPFEGDAINSLTLRGQTPVAFFSAAGPVQAQIAEQPAQETTARGG